MIQSFENNEDYMNMIYCIIFICNYFLATIIIAFLVGRGIFSCIYNFYNKSCLCSSCNDEQCSCCVYCNCNQSKNIIDNDNDEEDNKKKTKKVVLLQNIHCVKKYFLNDGQEIFIDHKNNIAFLKNEIELEIKNVNYYLHNGEQMLIDSENNLYNLNTHEFVEKLVTSSSIVDLTQEEEEVVDLTQEDNTENEEDKEEITSDEENDDDITDNLGTASLEMLRRNGRFRSDYEKIKNLYYTNFEKNDNNNDNEETTKEEEDNNSSNKENKKKQIDVRKINYDNYGNCVFIDENNNLYNLEYPYEKIKNLY